ncbi:uncharacterized protein LOC129256200 [Lytechinus pictus]|uniref:uncharacterized protein LOC129256200 n=1 Tax=Lytechinus pictus TaxID=7653 RepID=UPI0030B9F884
MMNTISFLILLFEILVTAVSGSDCIGNTTCINNEVCQDGGCVCPTSHYGAKCEFKVTNALIIVLICTLPPISWLAVCCYGVHSKGSGLWSGTREREISSDEFEREAEEEVIDDQPPPPYEQSLYYNTAGTFEGVNMIIDEPGSDNMEPPPSYLEWTRKAASLRNQEISCVDSGDIGLVTISDNFPVTGQDVEVNVESEEQC